MRWRPAIPKCTRRLEALRCLQCKNAPCVEGCPVRIRIRDFIAAIVRGEFKESLEIIKENSLLPAVCGRVCPQEVQCQEKCTVGLKFEDIGKAVSIGRLERFVADLDRDNDSVPAVGPPTGMKVAVIGSGPGSIVAAADTRRAGHDVTIFEAFHKPGGVMVYGIPEFRLPKNNCAKRNRRPCQNGRQNRLQLCGRQNEDHRTVDERGWF